jgi:hypothetical protein
METPVHTILIFETNIKFKKDVQQIATVMAADARIKKWNVDRADNSNVLRIEANSLTAGDVVALIKTAGYSCTELTD